MYLNWQRVKTIILYSWYHVTHSIETWVDLVWFPFIEIMTFGFFGSFLSGDSATAAQLVLSGVVLWEVVRIVQYSITIGIMWDIWSNSFSTLFVGPLQMKELIVGHALSGLLKALVVFVFLNICSVLFFGFTPLVIGPSILIYFLLLTWFSALAGIFVFALILRYGTDIQSFSWSLIFLFQPLSAVFYPLTALPESIRWLAYASPVTYAMEAFRHQLSTGQLAWHNLGLSVLVNALYTIVILWHFNRMYHFSRRTGAFARMEM
jgi:ABC-2 type transport system permease protein